ncbi:MAG: urease accessory protein UreD [Hyphomicrobiaceae bacterium]|nr:MAG: urease accessory protein UreD [Hyphomicrobiaceae bacterium]
MGAAVLRYEPSIERRAAAARALQPVRQIGGTEIVLARRGAGTGIVEVGERGGYRVRFPDSEHGREAVLINTGGGMAGGDRAEHVVLAEAGAEALVTTPAAERIYRTLGPRTEIHARLNVGSGASLVWMPQETILFEGASLARRLDADVDPSASLLMLEMTVLGRAASGERPRRAALRDVWRIRRGGRLAFAENVSLDGDLEQIMLQPAVAGGAERVIATLLFVSPLATDRLDEVCEALRPAGRSAGASAWNGLLVARVLGCRLGVAREHVARVLGILMQRPLPRTWWT